MKLRRNNRIRILRKDSETGSVYHCVSRTVNKEFFWDDQAKEVLRRQLWKVAAFCGVDILAYCLMSNHFHILVRVVTDRSVSLSNEELWAKLRNFYTHPDDALVLAKWEEDLFGEQTERREAARKMLLARMDDLSYFMKILKQRFSIWYNRNHNRLGPHWCDRFQSVLVEDSQPALQMVAAYIALNPVRAGICRDPKDYRFSSYAEAVVGQEEALPGMLAVTGAQDGRTALAEFRLLVYAVGSKPKADGSGMVIDTEEARKVQQQGGKLSGSTVLFCKARYFTQGVAIGSAEYLERLMAAGVVKPSRKTRLRALLHEGLHTFRA